MFGTTKPGTLAASANDEASTIGFAETAEQNCSEIGAFLATNHGAIGAAIYTAYSALVATAESAFLAVRGVFGSATNIGLRSEVTIPTGYSY